MSQNRVVSVHGQSYALANGVVANDGEIACLNASNKVTAASVATGLRPIGLYDLKHGQPVTGDGTTPVRVRFLAPGEVVSCDNDATNPVVNAGSTVYLFDGHTVSVNATGTSIAGIAVAFDGTKVLVKIKGFVP